MAAEPPRCANARQVACRRGASRGPHSGLQVAPMQSGEAPQRRRWTWHSARRALLAYLGIKAVVKGQSRRAEGAGFERSPALRPRKSPGDTQTQAGAPAGRANSPTEVPTSLGTRKQAQPAQARHTAGSAAVVHTVVHRHKPNSRRSCMKTRWPGISPRTRAKQTHSTRHAGYLLHRAGSTTAVSSTTNSLRRKLVAARHFGSGCANSPLWPYSNAKHRQTNSTSPNAVLSGRHTPPGDSRRPAPWPLPALPHENRQAQHRGSRQLNSFKIQNFKKVVLSGIKARRPLNYKENRNSTPATAVKE